MKCPPCRKAKVRGKPGHAACRGAWYRKGCSCRCRAPKLEVRVPMMVAA